MDEYLQIENHVYKNQIRESLEIVKEYIKKNELILVGGIAMDYALKIKGSQIYDKYSIPDYDAISPDFYTHAKNIAEILCKKDFPDVSAAPAIHNTTVRVKVSNYTVFDSTYCPKEVYKNIKTLKYLGLTIIHPNHQKIDQYNSLSFLFDQTGISQNIYHRMEKDIERNKLLIEYFPIISQKKPKEYQTIEIPTSLITSTNFKLFENNDTSYIESNDTSYIKSNDTSYIESNDNICCHGFLAYSIYYQSISDIYEKNKYFLDKIDGNKITKLFENCIKSSFSIKNKNFIFEIPKNEYITLINGNDNIQEINNNLKKIYKISKIETYNKLLEVKPISQIYYTDKYNFEIFDISGRLLSCNLFKFEESDIIVSNYNYILSYFLMKYYFYNKDEYYLSYYLSLINIIEIANILSNNSKINQYNLVNFNYSISTYGKYNFNESFYYYIPNFNYLIKYHKNSSDKPGKLYPKYPECKVNKEFNEEESPFFSINGALNNKLKITNYIDILKKNNIL